MEIVDIQATTVEVERRYGFGTSTCGFVAITADDGTRGIGEIPDIEDPESAPTASEIADEVASFLTGRDPRRVNALTTEMYDAIDFGPFEFHSFQQLVLGAVDTALYDLVATHYDIPVYQLLGGETNDVPITWVVFTRGSEDELDALTDEVREKTEQGFNAFKLKVGDIDPDLDERRVAKVREIAGDDATILLDAQGHWTKEDAVEHIPRFEPYDIAGVETPVGHPDHNVDAPGYYYDIPLFPADLAEVRNAVDAPIIEHVLDPSFGIKLAEEDAVDVFTVEVCSGGINRAQRILNLADAADIDARLGSTVELEPGTMAALAVASSAPAITYPCDLIGPALYTDSVVDDPVEYTNGYLRPRDDPGFGLSLQEDLL